MRSHALAFATALTVCTATASVGAQPYSSPRMPIQSHTTALHNGLQSLTSPGSLRALVVGGLLTGLATRYDDHSGTAFDKPPFGESALMEMGDNFGNGKYLMAASATTWGTGLLFHSEELKTTGRTLVLGLATDVLVVTSVKLLARRERPDGSDFHSFPSGHTSGAFTASTVLSRRYGWKIGAPAYALATLTAMDRMEDRKHFASDVVAGAALGIIIGRAVTASAEKPDARLKLEPAGLGAKLSFSF